MNPQEYVLDLCCCIDYCSYAVYHQDHCGSKSAFGAGRFVLFLVKLDGDLGGV